MLALTQLLLVSTINLPAEPILPPTLLAAPAKDDSKPGFSYTYVESNYLRLNSDAANDHLDGIELIGSLSLPMNFFAQVSASRMNGVADLTELRLGGGWHISLGKTIDAYGVLSFVDHNYSNGVSDQNGLTLDAGARLMLTPQLEADGFAEWADVEKSEVGLGLGARYYLTHSISLGVRGLFIDTGNEGAAGVRFQF